MLVFDPRFLVFEFIYNILLRAPQVRLVRSFMASLDGKNASHCEQMIMGGGKTTVVAPLLALLLADGKSLVVQVVPAALLEFSRTTMRERFSAVITKSVYTFRFDRYSDVSEELVAKLERAKISGAVVCTSPSALKSLVLKGLLLAHDLELSSRVATAEAEEAAGRSRGLAALGSALFGGSGRSGGSAARAGEAAWTDPPLFLMARAG